MTQPTDKSALALSHRNQSKPRTHYIRQYLEQDPSAIEAGLDGGRYWFRDRAMEELTEIEAILEAYDVLLQQSQSGQAAGGEP